MADAARPATLIQCIGNRLRRDDGAGPRVADRLRAAGLPQDVELQEHWGEGSELMRHWPGAARVILVDAACSGAAPGLVHRLDASSSPLPRGLCYYSTHRFGIREAIEVARVLGQLPPLLQVVAIEGADFQLGEGLSPAVAEAVRGVSESILREIA